MTDRSAYLELVRELTMGDSEAYRRRCDELNEKGWGELRVVGAGFCLAARWRLDTFSEQAAITSSIISAYGGSWIPSSAGHGGTGRFTADRQRRSPPS